MNSVEARLWKESFFNEKFFLKIFSLKLFSGDKYGKFVVIISDYHESWLQKCIKGDHQVRLGFIHAFQIFSHALQFWGGGRI